MRQDGGHEVAPGPSILELIWKELDESYAELMVMGGDHHANTDDIEQLKGRCAGLAVAIAIIRNPYDPNDDIIRDEVAERYAGGDA